MNEELEKAERMKQLDWQFNNETTSTTGIECPNCFYVETDPESLYNLEDGDEETLQCNSCDKEFTVTHCITHSWTTLPIHEKFNKKTHYHEGSCDSSCPSL